MNVYAVVAASIASVTALLIAFVAYPWQKGKDRDQKVDEERRRALAELTNAIEGVLAKVRASAPVAIEDVPNVSEERILLQQALSMVRAYGCVGVVDRAIDYDRKIRIYRKSLEKEKALRIKRTKEIPEGARFSRGAEYSEAQDQTAKRYSELKVSRDQFFEELSKTLGIRVPSAELTADQDSENEEA